MRWSALLLSIGCGGTTPPDNPRPTATETTDTGAYAATTTPTPPDTGITGWMPTVYRVNSSAFGVRAGQVVSLDDEDYFGTPVVQQIELRVRIADDSIVNGPTPNNHCDVVLTVVDAAIPPMTSTAGAPLSFEMPTDATLSAAQCELLHPDPTLQDLGEVVVAHTWGFTVRELASADTDAIYGTPADNTLGGSWFVDGGPPQGPGLTLAYQIDAEGKVVRDANWDRVPMTATTAWDGIALQDGLYLGFALSDWSPLSDLLQATP